MCEYLQMKNRKLSRQNANTKYEISIIFQLFNESMNKNKCAFQRRWNDDFVQLKALLFYSWKRIKRFGCKRLHEQSEPKTKPQAAHKILQFIFNRANDEHWTHDGSNKFTFYLLNDSFQMIHAQHVDSFWIQLNKRWKIWVQKKIHSHMRIRSVCIKVAEMQKQKDFSLIFSPQMAWTVK